MQFSKLYSEAPAYYHYFFDLVATDDMLLEFENSRQATFQLFDTIPPHKENCAYEEGKWTVKEVLQHIIDCERIFMYRALRFARFDATPLPGFDENVYMANQNLAQISISDLRNEYNIVREASILLYKTFNDKMLDFKGIANGMQYTARMIAFIMIGHNLHHIQFVKSRYL
jgi:uncharacterized damage-inducible protein DinB